MDHLRIAGVPEHFNLPWQLGLEQGAFADQGIDLQWQFNKAGTGAMVKALKANEVDAAIVLTEGIVASIINGLEARIVKPFITTPLIWGIHTGNSSGLNNVRDCSGCSIAISRFGSGSHLMAMVDAEANNRLVLEDNFLVVTDMDGALEALKKNIAQVFYWEKFTTKPWVDSGQLRRIGEFVTPWPCFVIAATDKAIAEKGEVLTKTLDTITRVCSTFVASSNAVQLLIDRCGMKPEDATAWFYNTDWSYDYSISAKMLQNVMHALQRVNAIKRVVNADFLCSKGVNLR
jgi:sulfonate transport system substrate-binding protein